MMNDDTDVLLELVSESLYIQWELLHREFEDSYRGPNNSEEWMLDVLEDIEVIEFIMKHMGIHVPTLEDIG